MLEERNLKMNCIVASILIEVLLGPFPVFAAATDLKAQRILGLGYL